MSAEHSIELLTGGVMFDFDEPTVDMIQLEDIARSLSHICRFGGHVKRFYSVAEHTCMVYRLLWEAGLAAPICYAALHHDSHEAYLGDVPTPLKRKIKAMAPGVWENFEARIDSAVADKLGIEQRLFHAEAVKYNDELALAYEAAVLKPSGKAQIKHGGWTQVEREDVPSWAVKCWTPEFAEAQFLNCHRNALARCNAER